MTNAQQGRRRPETMKFAYSGPFVTLLDPRVGSSTKPIRDISGKVIVPAPRYAASAENYTIGAALGNDTALALEARFGRERRSSASRRKRTNRKEAKA